MNSKAAAVDLSSLEIFCAVAGELSVTRAAERLQRAQSNVTTRLRQLEQQLGTPLFLREGRRMSLTPEGRMFQGYAERLLALAAEACQALQPGRPKGRLRIGTMESTAASRLPAPLARFHRRWPEVALELDTGPSERLVERLLAHELDCALVADGGAPLDPGLEGQRLYREDIVLLLPADHPPLRGPAGLKVTSLAALEPGCTYRRLAQDWLGPRLSAMQLLELGSYHAIFACVAAGNAMGVAPMSVLELQATPPALRLHKLKRVDTLLLRRRGYASAAFEAWRETLLEPADHP